MDHFFQISMVGPAENDMLKGWATLAHLAAVTEKVTLGTMVTGVTYRHAGILVKTATTLDPHPKILVGGTGEKKTLRMVAEYADACNIFEMGPDAVRAKLDVLRAHCERLGRDYEAIERTTLGRLDLVRPGAERVEGSQTVAEAVERFAGYAAALAKITPAGR